MSVEVSWIHLRVMIMVMVLAFYVGHHRFHDQLKKNKVYDDGDDHMTKQHLIISLDDSHLIISRDIYRAILYC